MANTRTFSRSFSGGELSPEMFGRIDDAKFQSGAAVLRNFIATPQGPARNRPGFAFVKATKNNGQARLIPFAYNNTQTMVIELGDRYLRFHTMGETLQYVPSSIAPWVPPSMAISLSYTTPTIVTWNGHGLNTGDPVRFYMYGGHSPSELPAGFQVGYTYTVSVVDANTFNILDNGVPVALVGGSGGAATNYAGTGTATASLGLAPNQSGSNTSAALSGLPSVPVPGGTAKLNITLNSNLYLNGATGSIQYQYSTGGSWSGFYTSTANISTSITISIPIANLNTLQLRVVSRGTASSSGSAEIDGTINSWSVDVPTGGGGTGLTIVRAYRYYTAGDQASYSGSYYSSVAVDSGGITVPGTDSTVWLILPSDLTYELTSPYAVGDVFDIHYTQSADVMTLVHPSYPPMELRRLGASNWSIGPISFGAVVQTPTGVAIQASPGYQAQIQSISSTVITTRSNHTLSLGDQIYITGLKSGGTDLSGFYLVNSVPTDGSGNEIPNELTVMDYSGNILNVPSGYVLSPGTIQLGTKIFDITSVYAVSALDATGQNQSVLSTTVSALNNLNVPGSYNVITWTAVTGTKLYYVFKQKNGLWGFVGQAQGTTFTDNNIAPDFSITPTNLDNPFAGTDNYPAAVGYIEQRRVFAGTNNAPQTVDMTNSGTESTFSYSLPSQDTDRIAIKVAAREVSSILHIVPLVQLLLLTGSCEYAEFTTNDAPITPSTIGIRPQSYIGASNVQPTVVNNSLVYCAARGGHVREMGYNLQVNGYITGDLSLRSAHLFDLLTIKDQAFSKAPLPIVWFVSSNGNLVGLTYVPEQQIGAWHHHDTQGTFESVTAVSENDEDRVYVVINRTINGQTVRYVERMASRLITTLPNCFFVDSGATYSGTPATTISNLTWLEGQTVAVLGDGKVQRNKVVNGGAITLDSPASTVQVGLPYVADLQTLPVSLQVDGFGQGRKKNINKIWAKIYESSNFLAGPDANSLVRYAPPVGVSGLETDDAEVVLTPQWNDAGQLFIRQDQPLPLTVVDVTIEVSVGG